MNVHYGPGNVERIANALLHMHMQQRPPQHSPNGRQHFCMKWRHDRHLESVTSNRKYNLINRRIYLLENTEHSCQISSQTDLTEP